MSHRTRELTLHCLESIPAGLAGVAADVVVVDNASDDGSPDAIAAAHPEVHLVALDENLGFAKAVNLAASLARGRYLLLLNPDATCQPGAIAGLLDTARRQPEAGLWGGRVVDPDGRPDPGTARDVPTLWSLLCFATGLSTIGRGTRLLDPESLGRWARDSEREVGYLTGCFLLAERNAWQALDGFDERYWLYAEDLDLAHRARAAGLRPLFSPAGTVVHHSGASSAPADKLVRVLTGRTTFLRTRWSPRRAAVGLRLLATGVAGRAAVARLAPGDRGATWRAAWRRRPEWRPGYE